MSQNSNEKIINQQPIKMKKGIYSLKRPVFFAIMFVISIMISVFFVFISIFFRDKALHASQGWGAMQDGIMTNWAVIYVVGYIFLLILFFIINIILIVIYEKRIKDRGYKFKILKYIYLPVLIFLLIIIPFIPRMVDEIRENVYSHMNKLDALIGEEIRKDKIYKSCTHYVNKDMKLWFYYNVLPIFYPNTIGSSREYCSGWAESKIYFRASASKIPSACMQLNNNDLKDECIVVSVGKIEDCNLIINKANQRLCILKYAKNINDCNLVLDSENKESCIFEMSKNSGNCDLIQDPYSKRGCLILSRKTMEGCSTLDDVNIKDECILNFATKIEDCNLIQSSLLKNDCIGMVAIGFKNKELCNLITSEELRDGCIIELMSNASECNTFINSNTKNFCVLRLSKTPEDCNLIIESPRSIPKDLCILELVKRFNNKEWCDLMSSKDYKRDCLNIENK